MANTSRVFESVRQAKVLLAAQTWTQNGDLGAPSLSFAAPQFDAFAEHVQIIPTVGDDATISNVNCDRDERFSLVVEITVAAGNEADEEDAVLDRLEELADLAQRAFYDDTEPSQSDRYQMNDMDSISQVSFEVGETDLIEGLVGVARVAVTLEYRI